MLPHPSMPAGPDRRVRPMRTLPDRFGRPGAAAAHAPDMVGQVARLRAVIAAYVAERRTAGAGLERVLPEVRDIVRDAELAEGWPDELGVLMAQVVRWTIEAYVDDPELRDVPRFY